MVNKCREWNWENIRGFIAEAANLGFCIVKAKSEGA